MGQHPREEARGGEQTVVVKNRDAFQSRYGSGPRIADGDDGLGGNNGEFGGQLSNRGEFIKLARQNGIQYDLDWSNIRLGNLLNVRVICNNPFETDTEKVTELVRTIQRTNLRRTSLSKLVIQS